MSFFERLRVDYLKAARRSAMAFLRVLARLPSQGPVTVRVAWKDPSSAECTQPVEVTEHSSSTENGSANRLPVVSTSKKKLARNRFISC